MFFLSSPLYIGLPCRHKYRDALLTLLGTKKQNTTNFPHNPLLSLQECPPCGDRTAERGRGSVVQAVTGRHGQDVRVGGHKDSDYLSLRCERVSGDSLCDTGERCTLHTRSFFTVGAACLDLARIRFLASVCFRNSQLTCDVKMMGGEFA